MLIFEDERSNSEKSFEHTGGSFQVQVVGYDNGVLTNNTLNGIKIEISVSQDNLPKKLLDNGTISLPDVLLYEAKANTTIFFKITGQTSNYGVSVSVI